VRASHGRARIPHGHRGRPRWPWLLAGAALAGTIAALAWMSQPECFRTATTWITNELGFVENATWLAFLGGSILALRAAFAARSHRDRVATLVCAAFAVFCFVAAMEEISWGQAFFDWPTPRWFDAFNAQGESNLHNLWPFQDLSSLGVLLFALGGLATMFARARDRLQRWALPAEMAPLLALVACMAAVETFNDWTTVIPQPAAEIIGTMSELAELYGAIVCLGWAWLGGQSLAREWAAADDAAGTRRAA